MEKKKQDRHLDVPSEANRDKHINFTAIERGEQDPADEDLRLEDDDEEDEEMDEE